MVMVMVMVIMMMNMMMMVMIMMMMDDDDHDGSGGVEYDDDPMVNMKRPLRSHYRAASDPDKIDS